MEGDCGVTAMDWSVGEEEVEDPEEQAARPKMKIALTREKESLARRSRTLQCGRAAIPSTLAASWDTQMLGQFEASGISGGIITSDEVPKHLQSQGPDYNAE